MHASLLVNDFGEESFLRLLETIKRIEDVLLDLGFQLRLTFEDPGIDLEDLAKREGCRFEFIGGHHEASRGFVEVLVSDFGGARRVEKLPRTSSHLEGRQLQLCTRLSQVREHH